AFDGSEPAEEAASEALELADELDAELHYIEVVDITDFPNPIDWEEVIDRIELQSSEELDEVVEDARERGLFGGKRVTRGLPHEEILERAFRSSRPYKHRF
ncbi:MAG: universal stress protein, partial [Candidatus Nanohalobium sp.]